MKAVFVYTALAATAVAAVPHLREHAHGHLHRREASPQAVEHVVHHESNVVYVDQYGNRIPAPGSADAYGAPAPADAAPVSAAQGPPAVAPPPADEPRIPIGAPPSSQGGKSSTDDLFEGYSIAYSPYHGDGTCKTQDEVNQDLDKVKDYEMVRIYGVDCEQVPMIIKAAKANKFKIFAGIFNIDSAAADAQTLIDAAKNDWDLFDTVSVGNEAINKGQASVQQVVSAMSTVRGMLKSAGFKGHVVTVEVWNQLLIPENKALCEASDFAAINCHAFFDPNHKASEAGSTVERAVGQVEKACGKKVIVTESGWPSQGSPNGKAIPTPENQEAAITSLRDSFSKKNIVLFSAYNDDWKQDFDGSFGAEHFWGIHGNSPSN